jgi:hypothetical protein
LIWILSYGFADGEAFGEAAGEGADVFAFPIGPSFTILASSVPSVFFQYEPLASSFSVMSFMLAVFPALVMEVLPVTLKTRDCSLPAIANVFAF